MISLQFRVVLVDDHKMFREGVSALLARDGRIVVVGEGSSSEEAFQLTTRLKPDVLVLDVELDGAAARSTISRIRREVDHTRIVILTMHRDSVLRGELLRAGAAEYVTKDLSSQKLVDTIVGQAVAKSRTSEAARRVNQASSLLSPREHEVLVLMAQAKSNRAIGELMSIAEGTVKRHANNLFSKLEAKSRMDAVHRGRILGII